MKTHVSLYSLVALLAAAVAQEQRPPPQPPAGVLFERDVLYGTGGGEELKLDLARPETAEGPLPCIVILHGGGWAAGNKAQHVNMTWQFAQRGYVAATVGYRLAPKHRFPAAIQDVKCAVRFLRAHAERYGIDPQKFGAVGFSAGGHLAMMLGVMDQEDGLEGDGGWAEQSSKVQVVVNFFGPTDFLLDYPEASREILKTFMGGTKEEMPDQYRAASPVTYLNRGDAPILSFQGTQDPLVPHNQVYRLVDAMTKAGVGGRAEFLIGAGHGWIGAELLRSANEMRAFFDLHLKGRLPRMAAPEVK